jgi:hypothetical protein
MAHYGGPGSGMRRSAARRWSVERCKFSSSRRETRVSTGVRRRRASRPAMMIAPGKRINGSPGSAAGLAGGSVGAVTEARSGWDRACPSSMAMPTPVVQVRTTAACAVATS